MFRFFINRYAIIFNITLIFNKNGGSIYKGTFQTDKFSVFCQYVIYYRSLHNKSCNVPSDLGISVLILLLGNN
jgi:hypothetical protein